MDLPLVTKFFGFSSRRRRWVVLLLVGCLSGYAVYRVYHSPSVTRKRRRLIKVLGAMASMAELASDSAEMIGTLSRDLKGFLQSDSNEIPNSMKQISKIARAEEFSLSLTAVSEAMTRGVLRGYGSNMQNSRADTDSSLRLSFRDGVMDRVFSEAGTGFVSVVVGSFARNLVIGLFSNAAKPDFGKDESDLNRWVNALCDDKCRQLIADCIQKFVGTAVSVYLEKTMDVNIYDDVFAGLTNPKHKDKMKDVLVSVCNGAVETLVKTSHQMLTSTNTKPGLSSGSVHRIAEPDGAINASKHRNVPRESADEKMDGRWDNAAWSGAISSVMAVQSNRKFVFDVTGRVTLETLRSITEILLLKVSEGFRRSAHVVHDEVVDKGRRVIRYVAAKSSIIAAIFVAFYLHLFSSNRVFLVA